MSGRKIEDINVDPNLPYLIFLPDIFLPKFSSFLLRAPQRVLISLSWLLILVTPPVCAQQLSVRCYDVSDGLAHSQVVAMRQDRKGYLWFGTWEGLSRFDGYRFTNYGVRDGLGHPIVNNITEDRHGRLWFATNGGGVARLLDDPRDEAASALASSTPIERSHFASFRVGHSIESNRVNELLFDSADNLWCVTDEGLYRAAAETDRELQFKLVAASPPSAIRGAALADRHGRLWFGIAYELIQVVEDQTIKYGAEDGVGRDDIVSVVEDAQGRLLVANRREVFEFLAPSGSAAGKGRGSWHKLPLVLRRGQFIQTMQSDSKGDLWVGTSNGLVKYRDGKQTLYTDAQGLSNRNILALMEDGDGNLWISTAARGVCKLSGELIISFTKIEGVPSQTSVGVMEDRQGRIYTAIANVGLVEIVEGRAVPVPGAPRNWEGYAEPFQDSRGSWWFPSTTGLYRLEGPELQFRRRRRLTPPEGLAPDKHNFGWVLEDPLGRLWILYAGEALYRFDPLGGKRDPFERIPFEPALPSLVVSMMGDRAGTLWLSGHGLLARLMNGKLSVLRPTEGLPETEPRVFFQDSRGWLWIGLRYKGVSVVKDPTAETPQFVNYSTQSGLSSDTVWTITEDESGRIYLGTGKGLNQLDPVTDRIRHFNVRDGLAGDVIADSLRDQKGNIWLATSGGLSKFDPRAVRITDKPPPIYFSRVQVAGEDLPLPETGTHRIPELELSATRNNLAVEFVALSFHGEHRLRYQLKLAGVDKDWGEPTEARSVNYAQLAPGSYQLLVRAINQEGLLSAQPATFEFRILPPVWQRWWFIALMAFTALATIFALHRYRLAQLLALERVRTRIATDLHDDIGSSLSRVAILSEVVKREISGSAVSSAQSISLLTEIADSARGLVASMREIIWAIDPRQDELSNVVAQIRHFASDVLDPQRINWDFQVATEIETIKLDPEQRRHLFLIFKEAINNIARHADCRTVSLSLTISRNRLLGEIRDDGRGFATNGSEPAMIADGHGLENMRRRAAQVSGETVIDSTPGGGVSIKVMIPLKRP